MADSHVVSRLKHLLIDVMKLDLTPEQIDADRNYFQEKFGLSSIDALEFMVHIEREFDVEIADGYVRTLPRVSLIDLANYIEDLQAQG